MTIIEAKKASLFAVNVCFRHAITVLVPSSEAWGGEVGVSPLEIYERVGKSVIAF